MHESSSNISQSQSLRVGCPWNGSQRYVRQHDTQHYRSPINLAAASGAAWMILLVHEREP